MNALTIVPVTYLVLLLDESGPLGSSWETSHDLSPDRLIEVARVAFPLRDFSTVLKAEWATKPVVGQGREFHITIPGTHEVKARTPKPKNTKKHEEYDPYTPDEALSRDPSYWRRARLSRYAPPAAAPVDTSTDFVAKCCGISHTRASYRELEMISAVPRTEGFTVLLDEQRVCPCCKGVIAVTTKRLLGDR